MIGSARSAAMLVCCCGWKTTGGGDGGTGVGGLVVVGRRGRFFGLMGWLRGDVRCNPDICHRDCLCGRGSRGAD